MSNQELRPPPTPSKSSSKPSSVKSHGDASKPTSPASPPVEVAVVVDDTGAPCATRVSASANGIPKPAEKEGTWGRLQRIFSTHAKDQSKAQAELPAKSRATTPVLPGDRTPGRQSPDGLAPEKQAPPEKTAIDRHPTTFSLAPSITSSSKAISATASAASAASAVAAKLPAKDLPRFLQDSSLSGGHEHHLKSSRRQEKLSNKFKSLLGKKPDTAKFDDLSLVSDWVDAAMKRDMDTAVDKKGGPNDTKSLVEKYGKCHEVIGRGAFGIVRISHKKQENGERLFAVKEFRRRPEETEKRYSKRLRAEYNIGISLLHPNICRTLDLVCDDKNDLCEVMEYCAGGDLYTLVLSAGKLEAQEADCFFKQMMRGVQYLHEMGVAHRDLKPENLLLTTRGALKITDFGNGECFRYAGETEPHMVSGVCGSAPYIAPEEYTDKEFDGRAVDVWACGVIYMAMRTGRHLWNVAKKDEDEFYKNYLDGRKREDGYGPIETLRRARCRNVIYSILDPSATRRLTAVQVLRSEWVREIKLCRAGEEGL